MHAPRSIEKAHPRGHNLISRRGRRGGEENKTVKEYLGREKKGSKQLKTNLVFPYRPGHFFSLSPSAVNKLLPRSFSRTNSHRDYPAAGRAFVLSAIVVVVVCDRAKKTITGKEPYFSPTCKSWALAYTLRPIE